MKNSLLRQLDGMRETLLKNMEAIKSLMTTLDSLGELIKKLQNEEGKEGNKTTINTLTISKDNISKSLKEILSNTGKLFDTYREMVKTL